MSQLTREQRYTIQVLLQEKYKNKAIAVAIGVHPTTIGREIKRNSDLRSGKYTCDLAQRKCEKRHKEKPKYIHFTPEIKQEIEVYIKQDYSPEQAVGTMAKEGKKSVSIETIYKHVWSEKKKGILLYKHLRNQGKRYRKRGAKKDKRGIIEHRRSIDERPEIVTTRERFGDWEVDLVVGKNHKGFLVTINERQTGFALVKKIEVKSKEVVSQAIISELLPYKDFVKTITSDNGKEFANHQIIAQRLETDYYFAHPYHSWERGSNENFNGLLRQYVPKNETIKNYTDEKIKEIQNKLNNRPRKKLNFEKPINVFNQKIAFMT
jgi:IS30 family transposase